MCLLTFMQAGTTANIEHLSNGAWNNDDGFGFAVHAGDHIIKGHGMVFDTVLDKFLEVRRKHHGPALFHSRITTHGKTNVDNCHPFQVGDDHRTVLGHNGMLPIEVPRNGERSDTRIFAETYLPSLGGVYALDDPDTFSSLEKWSSGSKLVVITADPWANRDWYILNEQDGHWDSDGVWWSNNSYKNRYVSYSTGYGGWSMDAYTSLRNEPKDDALMNPYDEDEEAYWNLYAVTCPVCTYEEVYDFDVEDPDICGACGFCMWCESYCSECNCWDSVKPPKQFNGPKMEKIVGDELRQMLGLIDVAEGGE
jgi:glutamine amidotransferase